MRYEHPKRRSFIAERIPGGRWDLYMEPDWSRSCDSPPMGLVASCTSYEAAQAAQKLLEKP